MRLEDLRLLRSLRKLARRQGLSLIRIAPVTQRQLYDSHGPYVLRRVADGELVATRLDLRGLYRFLVTDLESDQVNWTSSPRRRRA